MSRIGAGLLGLLVLAAALAPLIAPNPPDRVMRDLLFAPPTRVYALAPEGLTAPYIYRLRTVSRLERRFAEDRPARVPLRLFHDGRLLSSADPEAPLLLLGTDGFGRCVFSRLVHGARTSLLLAALAAAGALLLGTLAGGVAGYAGGYVDDVVSRVSEFVLVLPAIYVLLALRAAMPLVVPDALVFTLMAVIFAAVGWPIVALGVRAIVAGERRQAYAEAARASGAGTARMLLRHLLPAAAPFLRMQAALLLPAFIVAEATLSFVGLGFSDRTASWGSALQDASNITIAADAPWLLAPAGAMFLLVLSVNLLVQGRGRAPIQLEP